MSHLKHNKTLTNFYKTFLVQNQTRKYNNNQSTQKYNSKEKHL